MKSHYVYIFFLLAIITLLIVQAKFLKIKLDENETEKETITVSIKLNEEVVNMNLEDYVIGVLACEMPALFEEEALKAGAVAARTFALEKIKRDPTYIFNGDTSDQCYSKEDELREKWQNEYETYYKKIKTQVKNTEGRFITYNGDIIKAYYFSVSNGQTENVESVFKQELDYLKSVSSPLDKNTKGYEKTITLSKIDFKNKLGIEESDEISIGEIIKNESKRVDTIVINSKTYEGVEVRKLLNLRSTDFSIELTKEGVNITTRGYGHGVGMSQYGANELAKLGYTYEEIIKHYYTDVEIQSI